MASHNSSHDPAEAMPAPDDAADRIHAMNHAVDKVESDLTKHTTLIRDIEVGAIAGQVLIDLDDATDSEADVIDIRDMLIAEGHRARRDHDPFLLRVDVLNH